MRCLDKTMGAGNKKLGVIAVLDMTSLVMNADGIVANGKKLSCRNGQAKAAVVYAVGNVIGRVKLL